MGRQQRRTRTTPVIEWVEQHLAPANDRGCRLWQMARNPKGYGVVCIGNGRTRNLSPFLWEHHHGPIPRGLLVCHHCDIPACGEIRHLFLGTAADNSADMVRKGRHVKARATLTPEQVRVIRQRLLAGESQTAIARDYRVHQASISGIATGRRWADVT